MSSSDHSRDSSSSSSSSSTTLSNAGSSYQLILEHLFTYPATYELPLRTVFVQNCEPRKHAMAPTSKTSSPRSSAGSASSKELQRQATADFTSSLVSHIAQLPSQPCSLPPAFIASFLRRCFSPELAMVDFPQALTGLDYLKDLETRRRRDHEAALRRLGVSQDDLRDPDQLKSKHPQHPGVAAWLQTQEKHEKTMDTSYTQLYIGLRRWILINELMIQPFNKANCLAMLNTLFPPMANTPPTSKLTSHQIKAQRDAYFKWITRVETHYAKTASAPTEVLQPLMVHGKRPGDVNAWPAATEDLDIYLRAAQHLIDDYALIQSQDDLDVNGRYKLASSHSNDGASKKKERKADSGISFGSNKRPSTSGSLGGLTLVGEHTAKSSLKSPVAEAAPAKERSYSTLERLARELRRIKSTRSDKNSARVQALADEADKENRAVGNGHGRADSNGSSSTSSARGHSSHGPTDASASFPVGRGRDQAPALPAKGSTLRKAKSFSEMKRGMSPFGGSLSRKKTLERDSNDEVFDQEEMRRQRAMWEANSGRKAGVRV